MTKNSRIQKSQKQNQTPAKLHIREADLGDADSIAILSGQLGYPMTADAIKAQLEALKRGGMDRVFIAQLDGQPIAGWVQVSIVKHLMEPVFAEVIGLVVEEGARNQRIGAQLLGHAEGWARDQGMAKIRVRSNVIRNDAHRFYIKNGYSRLKSQHVFTKEIKNV